MVRLPSVQALLDIKVGTEQIKKMPTHAAERRVGRCHAAAAGRQREEGAETVRGRLEGLRSPSADSRGRQLWKQFVPAWQQWRNDNNEFFRISQEVDE